MEQQENTKSTSGLNILNATEIATSSAEELDLSTTTGDIIDPKEVAQGAKKNELDEEDVIETKPETDDSPDDDSANLDGADNSDDPEDLADDVETDGPEEEAKKKDSGEDEEEIETFKVLGQHFSDKGILEGFSEEMENTEEAFESMIQETVKKGIEEYKNNFENPVTKQFLDYLEQGGDPGRFMQVMAGPDYSRVTEEDVISNEATQKQIVKAYLLELGESSEEADETIQAYEDAGNLESKSKKALIKLQTTQAAQREAAMKEQKEQAKIQRQKAEEYLEELKDNINSKEELAGFKLTNRTKTDLYNYITKVDKAGKTQLMKDAESPENQLLMAFFHFNNFNFEKLEKKTKTKAQLDLIGKLSRHTDPSRKQISRKKTNTPKNEPGSLNLGIMKNIIKKG